MKGIIQNILIVSSADNQPILLCDKLQHHGISTTLVLDVRDAIHSLETYTYGFLLLDIDLDGANLFLDEIFGKFYNLMPYLLVADTFSNSNMRADLLNRGADACLEKPIDIDEVVAVINAALRWTTRCERKQNRLAPCIQYNGLLIDPLRRSVVIDERSVELTAKEFDVLYLLASHPGYVFSREQIYNHIWNDDYKFATTSVFDHISSLRQKLGISIKDRRYIQTIYGAGYRFAEK